MNIIFNELYNNSVAINEGTESTFGKRDGSFTSYDKYIGPDGTVYDTKFITAVVDDACSVLTEITQGTITPYLAELPILYTFNVPTMATNSRFIFINPGFVMQLLEWCGNSPAGVAFVIMHEVYHNLFLHREREMEHPELFPDHIRANAAQDYEINWVIEHSFPDTRTEKQAQAEGESIYDENGNINQIMGGVTKACHGLINEKYANKTWEDIYPLLTSEDDEDDGEVDNSERQVSDDFKEGYADGWNDAIRELRAKGLVENVVTPAFVIDNFIALLESAKDDYDAGYSEGFNKAMEIIMGIMSGGQGPTGTGPQMPNMPPIDGLQTMKPINPPEQKSIDDNSSNSSNDPNTPVEMPNNQSGSSAKSSQQNNPQGNSNNSQNIDGSDNQSGGFPDETSAAGADGSKVGDRSIGKAGREGTSGEDASELGNRNTNGLTSRKQAIENIMSNKRTVSVGVSNGKYSGKTSGIGNDHTMSETAGEILAKQAGYEEPTGKEYAGRNKNPFTSENADALIETLKKMDSNAKSVPGNTGGTGISSIIDRVTEISVSIVDWRAELKRHLVGYFNKLAPAGWSKKKIARGMYNRFRDYEGESMKNLIIMLDTSGSVFSEGDYLNQIITEFNTIAQQIRPKEIDLVLFCDGVYHHEILSKREIRDFNEVAHIRTGGTIYTDCFKYIEENYVDENKKFACCVIFTDMDLHYAKAQLPDENSISWNPGDPDLEGSGKLLWFVLNDEKDTVHLEVPYGTVLEVKQDDFVKSLKNNYKISESADNTAVPRRSIMRKPKLYEGYFKNYGDLKAQAAQAAAQEIDDTVAQSDSPEEVTAPASAPAKKRLDPVALRKRQMAAMRASGAMTQTANDIKSWISKNTNITSYNVEVSSYDLSAIINDTVELSGKTLTNIPAYIAIEKINGDLIIGGNPHLQYLPTALSCEVTGNFYCTNMPNLKSLEGMPYKIGGNVIINRCPRLETLTGAPASLDNFNGGFLSDGKFTEDDFYATIENGGIMPGEEYTGPYEDEEPVEESLSTKRPRSISKIVESRIALGKNFNKMNEAFESQILRNLANNPANREALDAMRKMNILWSEIPNDMITVVNNNVLKLRNLNKAPNNDETKFGLAICCDKNKRITCIFTGNKRGIWANNTWKYVPQSTLDLINERVELYDTANSVWKPADEVERAKDECRRIGINPDKQSLHNRGKVRTKHELSMEHLFFIPDLCRIAYLIKGIDDKDTLNGGGYARDFSYITQEKKREQMQADRKLANTGVLRNSRTRTIDREVVDDEGNTKTTSVTVPYSNRNVEKDPAFKKYMNLCITPEVFTNINRAHASGLGLRKAIESMTASVKDNADRVRTAVKDAIDAGYVTGSAADSLNLRFILAPAKKFERDSASMISRIDEYIANETKPYLDKLILNHTNTDEMTDIYNNIQDRNWQPYAPSGEYFTRYNRAIKDYYNASSWYKSYLNIVAVYAELLGAIAKAKRGNIEYLENYAQAVADATSNYNVGRFTDLTPSGKRRGY